MPELGDIRLFDSEGNEFALPGLIDFGPEPGSAREIMQCVITLLRTSIWSVPLDRLLGLDFRFVDLPIPVAEMQIQVEVFQRIAYFEPRCIASELAFGGDGLTGYLEPRVKIELKPEALPPDRRRQLRLLG